MRYVPLNDPMPWRCFHCSAVFDDREEAALHFKDLDSGKIQRARADRLEKENQRLKAEIVDLNKQIQDDIGKLLEALDMGNYARPESPREVMFQCIAKVQDLKTALHNALTVDDFERDAEIERLKAEIARLIDEHNASIDRIKLLVAELQR